MTILKLALDLMPELGGTRAYSATDLDVRMPVKVANPRALTSEMRSLGLIREVHRLGGQKFFVKVPGAVAPEDGRDCVSANRKRRQKTLLAKARDIRKLKRLKPP